jgi:hypothetical protein
MEGEMEEDVMEEEADEFMMGQWRTRPPSPLSLKPFTGKVARRRPRAYD